jgi:hypothetical protein
MGAQGTTTVDFGAFPGKSDTSVAVTGQTTILAGSLVEAWIFPTATADHTADEHMVETLKVMAGSVVAGTGFTIYAFNTSEISEPVVPASDAESRFVESTATAIAPKLAPIGANAQGGGGRGTMLYGLFTVAWVWN